MLISCGNVVIFDRFPQAIAHFWANINKKLSPIDHSLGKVDTIIVINKKQQIIHDSLLLMHSLYHQHNPSFCLDKHIGIATNYRINLIGGNWLSILGTCNCWRLIISAICSVRIPLFWLARQ